MLRTFATPIPLNLSYREEKITDSPVLQKKRKFSPESEQENNPPAKKPSVNSLASRKNSLCAIQLRKKFQENASLHKVDNGHSQWYEVDNVPIARPYRRKRTGVNDASDLNEVRVVGLSENGSVAIRANSDSPFYKKTVRRDSPRERIDDEKIEQIRSNTNELAKLAATNHVLKKYLIVEVMTRYDDTNIHYVTPAVDGYTLADYLNNPNDYPESIEQIAAGLRDLRRAISALTSHGFSHNDIHSENIMFNRQTGNLVLIDFEKAEKFEPTADNKKIHIINELKELRAVEQELTNKKEKMLRAAMPGSVV